MRNWIAELQARAMRGALAAGGNRTAAIVVAMMAAACASVAHADQASAADNDRRAVAPGPAPQLSTSARQTLEQLACQGPHQQPLDTLVARELPIHNQPHARLLEVEVRCRPHAEVHGQAVRYLHLCDDTGEHWTCSQAFQEFATTINGREVLVSSADLAPPDMFAMAQTVGTAAVIAAPAAAEPAHCRIAQRPGADPELYKMSCDVWELLVVRRCGAGRCSYRAIDRGAPLFQ